MTIIEKCMVKVSAHVLQLFIQRDVLELRALRDTQFESAMALGGTLVKSTVNGSSFEIQLDSALSPIEIANLAQLALDYKMKGICRPMQRTIMRIQ